MTSPQHAAWIRRGSPWQLARPLAILRDRLRGYGYTVFDLGDNRHLDAEPPEDHTPYSETGWPGATPYSWVTAIDIMPPPTAALPSLQALGGQFYADRQAGYSGTSWLKYMNWGPTSNNTAVHDQWEPGHVRSSSGDAGHIHLSCRSDATQSSAADTYDPVARVRGIRVSLLSGRDETMYVRDPAGGIYVQTVNGPVGITGAEWQSAGQPPFIQVDSAARLNELCPKVSAPASTVDVQALADALAPHLGVDQAAVLAALQSPEGQAALVQAANTAEDS